MGVSVIEIAGSVIIVEALLAGFSTLVAVMATLCWLTTTDGGV